jgi:hypothetical protein
MSLNGNMIYADCFQIAVASYYTYFALQDFNGDGEPLKGQCFLSNDLTQVTKYGNVDGFGRAITSYVSPLDNKIYGGPYANAVYVVSKALDTSTLSPLLIFMR